MVSEHRITIDIETIPDQRPGAADAARSRVAPPANYKDPVKIAAYIEAKADEAWRRTSLDGSYGEIIVIGYALGDDEPTAIYRDTLQPGSEKALLEGFWEMLDERLVPDPTWVGQYVAAFDLRFLWRRSVIHGIIPSRKLPINAPPWSREVADVSYMWTGERGRGVKLGDLAEILGLPTPKGDMDGSMVWDAFQEGRIGEIVDYCVGDVETARAAFLKMSFLPSMSAEVSDE